MRSNYNFSQDKNNKPKTSFESDGNQSTPYNKWYDDENMSYKERVVHFIISFKMSS